MATIMINTDIDAPGCPCEIVLLGDDGKHVDSVLVQTDYEFPNFASTFGWSVSDVQGSIEDCQHDNTDGSVKCSCCGLSASAFIESAREFLSDNDGLTADDPGYFG